MQQSTQHMKDCDLSNDCCNPHAMVKLQWEVTYFLHCADLMIELISSNRCSYIQNQWLIKHTIPIEMSYLTVKVGLLVKCPKLLKQTVKLHHGSLIYHVTSLKAWFMVRMSNQQGLKKGKLEVNRLTLLTHIENMSEPIASFTVPN